jgi:hypothetical protein
MSIGRHWRTTEWVRRLDEVAGPWAVVAGPTWATGGGSWADLGHAQGGEMELVWADGGSFGPWPYLRLKTFSIFQSIFQFTNYFEFNSNLNFE